MLRVLVLAGFALMMFGCSSPIGTFFNRPVVEDGIDGAVSTVSLSADRRTVVVVTEPGLNRAKFCAEPPPDTAVGLQTQLEAALKATTPNGVDVEGEAAERFATTVTVIAERTASLDVFRTGVYALCQLHLNDALSRQEVFTLFGALIKAYADPDLKRAEADPAGIQSELDRTRGELTGVRSQLESARSNELERVRQDLENARSEADKRNSE